MLHLIKMNAQEYKIQFNLMNTKATLRGKTYDVAEIFEPEASVVVVELKNYSNPCGVNFLFSYDDGENWREGFPCPDGICW